MFLLQQPADEVAQHTLIKYGLYWYYFQEYRLHMRLPGTTGPINALAFAPDAKLLASGGVCHALIMGESWRAVHRRWRETTCMGHQPQESLSGHWGRAGKMGPNYLHPVVDWSFWPQWHSLLRDWQRAGFGLSTNKRAGMFIHQYLGWVLTIE